MPTRNTKARKAINRNRDALAEVGLKVSAVRVGRKEGSSAEGTTRDDTTFGDHEGVGRMEFSRYPDDSQKRVGPLSS